MTIKGLLLVWFIMVVCWFLFGVIAKAWHKTHRLRSLREDYPAWLYIMTAFYILDILFTIVYTMVWICHM